MVWWIDRTGFDDKLDWIERVGFFLGGGVDNISQVDGYHLFGFVDGWVWFGCMDK